MFEIFLFIALVIYLYRDYQKAKLEGWTKNDYIRSWVKGIAIYMVIVVLLRFI